MVATTQPRVPDCIEFPPAPGFWKTTGLPPMRVELPLKSETELGLSFIIYLLIMALGLAGLIMGLSDFAAPRSLWPDRILLCLVGVGAWLMAIPTLFDLVRSKPILVIDSKGIWDRRTLRSILRWPEISEARVLRGHWPLDPIAVFLTTREPIDERFSMHLEGLQSLGPNRVSISLNGFANREVIGQVALTMVAHHGGKCAKVEGRFIASGA